MIYLFFGMASKSTHKKEIMLWRHAMINILSRENTHKWFHGVVVITPDFESGNLGSNPGGTYFFLTGKENL